MLRLFPDNVNDGSISYCLVHPLLYRVDETYVQICRSASQDPDRALSSEALVAAALVRPPRAPATFSTAVLSKASRCYKVDIPFDKFGGVVVYLHLLSLPTRYQILQCLVSGHWCVLHNNYYT